MTFCRQLCIANYLLLFFIFVFEFLGVCFSFFFFFQAEDGIRDHCVTGVQTCALPIWGGSTSFQDVNTGGQYIPGTNTWTATSTTNAPSARDSHTAVWTGSETGSAMIVWGGSSNGVVVNTGGRYCAQGAPSPTPTPTPTPTSTPTPTPRPTPPPRPTSTPRMHPTPPPRP